MFGIGPDGEPRSFGGERVKIYILKICLLLYSMLSIGEVEYQRTNIMEAADSAILNNELEITLNGLPKEIAEEANSFILPSNSEIKDYLNMTINEIEEVTGSKTEKMLSILPFPVIYSKNKPYWFICSDWDTNSKPLYLVFYEECEDEYLNYLGLKDAKNFSNIMDVMGNAEVIVSRTGDEMEEIKDRVGDYTYYKIVYKRDNLLYVFISD